MRLRHLCLHLLLVAFLAIGGPSAQADDLEQFLRTAVGAPVEARVAWPPVARLSPGDRVGPDGQVIEMGAAEAKVEKQAATADRHPITPDKLDIGAFWPWRFLAEDLRHLSLALTLKDVVRETVQGGDQSAAPEQGFRVGTVWRARFSITVSKGPDLTEERWQALRAAALHDESETIKPGVSTIRLEPAQQVPLVWLPADDRRASPASTKERLVAPKRWALLTVASGVYRFLPPAMNQNWNAENARLVRDALSEWSPAVVRNLDARPGAVAQAQGAEPGRGGALDLIEGEEGRPGREGRPALLPAVPDPSRQGLQNQRIGSGIGWRPERAASRSDGGGGSLIHARP